MTNRLGGGFGRGIRRGATDNATQEDIDDSRLSGIGATADGEGLFGYPSMAMWAAGMPSASGNAAAASDSGAATAPAETVSDEGVSLSAQQDWSLIRLDAMRADVRFNFLTGAGLSVAVLDTGIRSHSAFGNRLVFSYDFSGSNDSNATDTQGHGTHVASTVGGQDPTFTGMAPGVNIIMLKVFPDGANPLASNTDIGEALSWVVANRAAYKIVSVNMSLGSGNTNFTTTTSYSNQIATLVANNTAVVVASGNSYAGVQGVGSPSSDPNAWSIGAVWDRNAGAAAGDRSSGPDRIIGFSQRSTTMSTVFAPGGEIWGADYLSGGYVTKSGTSMAAPHIAGLVADMQQLAMTYGGRFLSVADLKSTMLAGARTIFDGDDEDDNVPNTFANYKRVDAYNWASNALSLIYAGTTGADSLMGTALGDVIRGNSGNDGINGMAGNDQLFGDAGNDFLNGSTGNDILTGGSNADTFYFSFGYGQDTVSDFNHAEGDKIDFTSFDYVHNLYQVYSRSMQVGANTFFDLGGGDYLTLSNFTRTNLVASDFNFQFVSVTESVGATATTQVGNSYFFDSSNGALGPKLRLGGANFTVGSNGNWRIIGTELQPNGYAAWWKNGALDQYVMWNTDSGGNYVSNGPLVNAISYRLQSLEGPFGQDLNSDGVIGPRSTVVESAGSTRLAIVGDMYFMYQGSGATGATLRQNGDYVVWGTSPWNVLGVERWSGGYQVAWRNGSANEFAVWTTDILGNFWTSSTGLNSSSYALQSMETSFGQDLNGDGTLGVVSSLVEQAGTTRLARVADFYFMYQGNGTTGAVLQQNGSPAMSGGIWTVLGAERWSGGYQAMWKNTQTSQYALWTTDLGGNFLASSNVMSAGSYALETQESAFVQDFNGDGTVGVVSSLIEQAGTTKLARVADFYFMYQGSGATGAVLQQNGSPVMTSGVWSALGTERWSGGYQVVWRDTSTNQFALWTTDLAGNFLSSSNVMTGNSAALRALEVSFNQDFNSSGAIGTSFAEDAGEYGFEPWDNGSNQPNASLFTNYMAAAFATPAGGGTGVAAATPSSDQDFLTKPMG